MYSIFEYTASVLNEEYRGKRSEVCKDVRYKRVQGDPQKSCYEKKRCQGRQAPTIVSPRYSDGDDSIWYNSGQPDLACT